MDEKLEKKIEERLEGTARKIEDELAKTMKKLTDQALKDIPWEAPAK